MGAIPFLDTRRFLTGSSLWMVLRSTPQQPHTLCSDMPSTVSCSLALLVTENHPRWGWMLANNLMKQNVFWGSLTMFFSLLLPMVTVFLFPESLMPGNFTSDGEHTKMCLFASESPFGTLNLGMLGGWVALSSGPVVLSLLRCSNRVKGRLHFLSIECLQDFLWNKSFLFRNSSYRSSEW